MATRPRRASCPRLQSRLQTAEMAMVFSTPCTLVFLNTISPGMLLMFWIFVVSQQLHAASSHLCFANLESDSFKLGASIRQAFTLATSCQTQILKQRLQKCLRKVQVESNCMQPPYCIHERPYMLQAAF